MIIINSFSAYMLDKWICWKHYFSFTDNLEILDKETTVLPQRENRIRNQRFKLTVDNKLMSVQKEQVLEGSDLEKDTRLKPTKVQMLPEKDNKTVDVYDFQE